MYLVIGKPTTVLVVWLAAQLATGQSYQDRQGTIVIMGKSREEFTPMRGGQNQVLRPKDATRYDSKNFLVRNPTIHLEETGSIKPSGFALPRIRGQHSKMTDIFLGDIQLSDPYTGLPLTEDMDLQAFGELQVYEGLTPPDLPSLNVIGAIRYVPRPIMTPGTTISYATGRPYGLGLWSMHEDRQDWGTYKVYGRHHQTDGRYKYYSNNSTPYNVDDDQILYRTNNHSRSHQVFATTDFKWRRGIITLLGWHNNTKRGLPTLDPKVPSNARQSHHHNLSAIHYTSPLTWDHPLSPQEWSFGITYGDTLRVFTDPNQSFLPWHSTTKAQVSSLGITSKLRWRSPSWSTAMGFDGRRSHVTTEADGQRQMEIKRSTFRQFAGFTKRFHSLKWEFKEAFQIIKDRIPSSGTSISIGNPLSPQRTLTTYGFGTSLSYKITAGSQVYGQYGEHSRPPSLLEEFGNGGVILGNDQLKPETTHHKEIGLSLGNNRNGLSLAVFQDISTDKIIFTRSMGQTSKAQNIQESTIGGISIGARFNWMDTGLNIGLLRMEPLDTTAGSTKLLPGIAESTAVIGIEKDILGITFRTNSRYRSQTSLDSDGTVVVPAHTVHDVSLDQRLKWNDNLLKLGLSITNVTNVMKLPIAAPGTSDTGYGSYSTIQGHPLPGRTWKLTIVVEL